MKQFYSKLKGLLLISFLGASFASFSQNVGINGTGAAPAASAGLDVNFTDKGLLIPNVSLLSLTDNTTIASPAESLLIYNTNPAIGKGYYYWDSLTWVPMAQFLTGTTSTANLGLGTSTPKNRLSINGIAPLALHGVEPGTTTDSLLTISGGVVKRLYPGSLTVSSNNAWAFVGNNLGANNYYIGTNDNTPLNFRTFGTQAMRIDATGNVGIGSNPTFTASPNAEKLLVDAGATTTSYNLISAKGTKDGYLQLNVQNRSAGVGASSDVVASNNLASETANYIDMGINSTGNTSTGVLGGASTAYLYSTGGDLAIGNAAAGKDLVLFTNGTTVDNEQMRITSDGQVGIGSADFDTDVPEKMIIDATGYKTALGAYGNTNSYLQAIVQNGNSGNNASSDFVVANDLTPTSDFPDGYYLDFGINSTGYAETKSNILNQKSTPYLYSSAPQWFYIGNGYPQKGIVFFTNPGSLNKAASADGVPSMVVTAGTGNGATGNVGIGNFVGTGNQDPNTYYVTEKLMVDGNITPKTTGGGSLGTTTYRWSNVYANTVYNSNGVITSSDRRLKTNIAGLKYGLKEVLSLQPVSYTLKSTPEIGTQLGLIAQDAKKVVPEIVNGDESKEMLGVNYTELVPVLINAIKEQQKQIEELKQKVTALEKK